MRGSPKEGEMKQKIIDNIKNAAAIAESTFPWRV
jgi:hypothetical protein